MNYLIGYIGKFRKGKFDGTAEIIQIIQIMPYWAKVIVMENWANNIIITGIVASMVNQIVLALIEKQWIDLWIV